MYTRMEGIMLSGNVVVVLLCFIFLFYNIFACLFAFVLVFVSFLHFLGFPIFHSCLFLESFSFFCLLLLNVSFILRIRKCKARRKLQHLPLSCR